jgi:hypothetical protein
MSSRHGPDYEYDDDWALEEPRRKGTTTKSGSAPPVFAQPPSSLGVSGPSGIQRQRPSPVIQEQSQNLVDIEVDTLTDTGAETFARTTPHRRGPPPVAHQNFASLLQDGYDDEFTGFRRPNVLRHEEDEDYNDEDHPSGFIRDNEADMAERAGHPPDGMYPRECYL